MRNTAKEEYERYLINLGREHQALATVSSSRPSTSPTQEKTLIIGFGNPDRQDDGVAWHILKKLAEKLGRALHESVYDDLDQTESPPHLLCMLQLTPEVAEILSYYERAYFVDAHTGSFEEEIRFEAIEAQFQTSPFTHHLTPQTCLMMAQTLYGNVPQAGVLSVRGYEFGFCQGLSPRTATLAENAVTLILSWLTSPTTAE
jgi:hydrogenase maturation protease